MAQDLLLRIRFKASWFITFNLTYLISVSHIYFRVYYKTAFFLVSMENENRNTENENDAWFVQDLKRFYGKSFPVS